MRVIVVTAAEQLPDNGLVHHLDNSAYEVIREGLKLKQSGQADELLVSCVGGQFSNKTIHKLVKQGVDSCHHSDCEYSPSTIEIAETLESLIRETAPDLILIGRPPGDASGQLGQMLKELIEFRSQCLVVPDQQHRLLVIREVGSGMHTVALPVAALDHPLTSATTALPVMGLL